MDVVPYECSTIVSLPVHIEGLQSFVESPENRTLAFHKFPLADFIIESVDSICRDSADTQYMLIQTNFSKSPKQLTYKLL